MAPQRAGSQARSRTPARAAAIAAAERITSQSVSASKAARASSKSATAAAPAAPTPVAQPVTTHYEFSGPYIGPIGIIVGLPVLTWAYSFFCSGAGWPAVPGGASGWAAFSSLTAADITAAVAGTWDSKVFGAYCAYWFILAALYFVLPGGSGEGVVLRDGSRLRYPFNGLASLATTTLAAGLTWYYEPLGFKLSMLYDLFPQIVTSTIAFSALLSVFLYAYSFRAVDGPTGRAPLLAEGGNSGKWLYDFFIGRELNPRVLGGLDLKYFCELRPGLTQWAMLNLAFAAKQVELQAAAGAASAAAAAAASPLFTLPLFLGGAPVTTFGLGGLSWAMLMVVLLEGYYVIDSVLNEPAILTTMDITTDGFGFMLAFGDLAWVPAMYSLQARYLATASPSALGIAAHPAFIALALLLALGSMYLFRASNGQKDAFKRNPGAPEFEGIATIPTKTGTRLLAGGYWGLSRHFNYLADWLMAVAWCLPTGFGTPLTYFYPAYFAVLLIHRERRDEEKCHAKYGAAWEEYCRRVPYRIVPGIY